MTTNLQARIAVIKMQTLIAAALIISGCEKQSEKKMKTWAEIDALAQNDGSKRAMARTTLRTVVIDGCEYLEFKMDDGRGHGYTHKGNCTNILHSRQ